jgi:hypothetical protein
MAKIRLDLSQFKASGVYTIEFDQTESIVLNTQTTRLVVGFSKKGPINAPVFCQDVKTAKRIFGDIDTSLESRGSFFHRSLFTCLETGPCFALALMPLNNDVDSSNPDYDKFKSFSLSTTEANGSTVQKLYSSYFNKERFYFPDTSYFLANVENSANAGKLLSFVNLGQTPFSIIVRKTGDLAGFNVTARDWFGAGNVPSFVKEFDFISEYFVQVDIVQGDWTNIQQLSLDPVFSQFFDAKGLKKDKIQAFLNSPDVVTIGTFQGCLIPDLIDGNGVNYSIDTIINNNVATTGLFVALNRNALINYDPADVNNPGRVDMVGHTLIDSTAETIDFLSYNFPAAEDFLFTGQATFSGITGMNFGPTAVAGIPAPGGTGYFAGVGPTFNSWFPGYTGANTSRVAYYESYYGSGNEGKFNNLLVVEKAYLNTDQKTYFSSLVAGQSIFSENGAGGGATSGSYGVISSVNETTDRYKFGIAHPDKATEAATSNATLVSVSSPTIVVGGTAAGLTAGDWLFTENTGVRYYFRATALAATGSNTAVTVDITNFGGANNISELGSATPIANWKAYWGSNFNVVDPWPTSGTGTVYSDVAPNALYYQAPVGSTAGYHVAYEGSDLYQKFVSGILTNGDTAYVSSMSTNPLYLTSEFTRESNNVKILKLYAWTDASFTTPYTGAWNYANFVENDGVTAAGGMLIYSLVGDYSYSIPVGATAFNASRNKVYIPSTYEGKAQVGQYLVADPEGTGDPSKFLLTRILAKKKITSGSFNGTYELTVNQSLPSTGSYATNIVRYKTVQEAAPGVQFSYLPGFKLTNYHLPGTKAQLAKILGMLDPANSNLKSGLSDRNVIAFRYIIDTFNGGLDTQSYPKNLITKLAMSRQKCMAIMNTPSIQEFIDSTDPRFTEVPTATDPKPLLNTRYIAEGGNLSLGPSFTYSLPDEENGAKFAGFFAPFLIVRENNKNIAIPPAADVSNNFIRKFLNGQPYSIVAGPRRGVLSNPRLVSLEYEFTDEDRANLEPFGWNPIVFRNNVGFMIFGNQTAYQRTLTAFNNLHVRDLLITVEESVEDVLQNYLFEFNDATTRLEIKSIVDRFLDNVRSAGGIYDFRTIMDTSNNTPDIIDQNFAIIDIGIEPVRGAQKFINRITVLKTGQIASGGFSVA